MELLNKLLVTPRGRNALVYLLWHAPNWIAMRLAARLVAKQHDSTSSSCVPCHAQSRIKYAKHAQAIGLHAELYCENCLAKPGSWMWGRHCTHNRPAQKAPQRNGTTRFRLAFWE